ncbi:hypothetical protein HXX76_013667 [Chlamydomonas incerta]|uniref:Kringle domain-containing protein n=1 Tax=Chlamydomonas incerta TaxID=51695 RepID=A0A835VQH2_CHLIN|nr:hypothetical protein HXX76_013667 [Chlamydomonas incerta]|eukprot:KAG2425457.1 hypothetical protein HXX76_013667 [Chlamydomonas incerta]
MARCQRYALRTTGHWAVCLIGIALVLQAPAFTNSQRLGRRLQQFEPADEVLPVEEAAPAETPVGATKHVEDSVTRPFFKVADPGDVDAVTALRVYEQGAQVASIAYLLQGAADSLSKAPGSSNALLPYLDPTILRLYAAGPHRCNSHTAELLYDLSAVLYGSGELQACHYALYQALRSVFAWVRDNTPLALVQLPGQPDARVALPDPDLISDLELVLAVAGALADPEQLGGETAELLQGSCGLSREAFAGVVPQVTAALAALHADLPLLQSIAATLHERHWDPEVSEGPGEQAQQRRRGRRVLWLEPGRSVEVYDDAMADPEAQSDLEAALGAVAQDEFDHTIRRRAARRGGSAAAAGARQLLAASSSGSVTYSMPPSTFTIAAPATLPKLFIPIVFHIMLYKEANGTTGPANFAQALSYVNRLVRITNSMAKPMNVQFYVGEVRSDAAAYPYLMIPDRTTWLNLPVCTAGAATCLNTEAYVGPLLVDWPRSINVFVASDSLAGTNVPLGYAYVPGSDLKAVNGHVFITWDTLSVDGSNRLSLYNDGPNTLLHELFHHLGLQHPFGPTNDAANSCNDDDYVVDTPTTLGSASSSSFISTASAYCMETFWGVYGGDWDATYARWSSTLGVPEGDMNAWADSCPTQAGYDELGNYMTYNTPVCFPALGHFTRGQAEMAHYVSAELNPIMYSWGQYYAAVSPSPPPQASPPPEAYTNICKATSKNCACKATWTLNGNNYAFCDRTGTTNSLACEVADPASCADCASFGSAQCILSCTGTARQCRKSLAPGTFTPPPPPPRPPSPPPMPPPPPPRAIPSTCLKASNGCKCRSTWRFNGQYWSYCASPDGDKNLWCQVESTCPGFNTSSAYQYCDPSLTLTSCKVQEVFFSQTRNPPWPPAPPASPSPPPDLRPRPPPSPASPPPPSPPPTASPPPPPPPVTVASINASVTIAANCSLLTNATNTAALRANLTAELSRILGVPGSYITIWSFGCGSIVANYTVAFPSGTTAAQVDTVKTATSSVPPASFSTSFTSSWGTVTTSSSGDVVVLQPAQLCPAGSPTSALCPASPPPPPATLLVPTPSPSPSSSKKTVLPMAAIIGIAAGGGALLLAILIIIIVCACRSGPKPAHAPPGGKGKVAPQPQYAPQQAAPQQQYYGGGGAPPPGGMPAANFRPAGGYDAAQQQGNIPYYRQQQPPQQQGYPQYPVYPTGYQ